MWLWFIYGQVEGSEVSEEEQIMRAIALSLHGNAEKSAADEDKDKEAEERAAREKEEEEERKRKEEEEKKKKEEEEEKRRLTPLNRAELDDFCAG